MSTPIRPANVPADATCIYPGQSFGPGVGVQQATIRAIEAQNQHLNANAALRYQQAMSDWSYNAEWARAAHQRVPPPPPQPQMIVDHVIYALMDGTVIEPPDGADGNHYAWIWKMYE